MNSFCCHAWVFGARSLGPAARLKRGDFGGGLHLRRPQHLVVERVALNPKDPKQGPWMKHSCCSLFCFSLPLNGVHTASGRKKKIAADLTLANLSALKAASDETRGKDDDKYVSNGKNPDRIRKVLKSQTSSGCKCNRQSENSVFCFAVVKTCIGVFLAVMSSSTKVLEGSDLQNVAPSLCPLLESFKAWTRRFVMVFARQRGCRWRHRDG